MAAHKDKGEIVQIDKIRRALMLARQGKSVTTIANELGTSTGAVSRMIAEGLKVLRNEMSYDADHYRDLIASRLEYALECIQPELAQGKVFAAEKWTSINMSLAKLYGVADPGTPASVNVNITTGGEAPALPPGLESGLDKVLRLLNRSAERLETLGIKEMNDVVDGQVRQLADDEGDDPTDWSTGK